MVARVADAGRESLGVDAGVLIERDEVLGVRVTKHIAATGRC